MKPSLATHKVLAEQLQLLYGNSAAPVSVSMFVAAILVWSQWDISDHFLLLSWLTATIAVSAGRLMAIYLFFRRDRRQNQLSKWNYLFLLGAYLSGSTWGAAAFLVFPEHSPFHQMVFTVLVAGLSSGAIASLCPSWPAVFGFLNLILIPLGIRFMSLEASNTLFLGLIVLLFLATTLLGSRRVHDNIRENICLRLESSGRETVLKASEERYRHIFNNAPLGIFHYDDQGVIMDCNDVFSEIIGSPREQLVGLQMFSQLKDREMLAAVRLSLEQGEGYYEGDYVSVTARKATPVRVFMRSVRATDNAIIGGVGIVEDLTERKLSEEQVHYYASYDALTGLPNRQSLLEVLGRELSRADRHARNGALLYIDLDNFKNVNESLGHSIGDQLLKMAAARLTHGLRREDTAARTGGDEFVIILPDLDDRLEVAAKLAQIVAEKLCATLEAPFLINDQELHVTPSIGISLFPVAGMGVDDILKQADTAMYKAKAAGRNAIKFFLPSMQKAADERLRLNTELRKALANDELMALFQPQARRDGRITGAEVLLRWNHPERGMIPPAQFIPIAEESGIIKELGQWVLLTACRRIREWSDAGLLSADQSIAVNISPLEFAAEDFVEKVMATLRETGATPRQLDIELTEGSLISNVEGAVEKINALRQLGIKFSVDDFGTGYSSLSYLKRLPLNTLKIDRSFIKDIADDPNDAAIVETIIMMANNLEMDVVAEGVETEQQLDFLSTKGCDIYQGYYFSRPIPVDQFVILLRSQGDRKLQSARQIAEDRLPMDREMMI